jgi:hypothetical protein
MQKYPPTRYEIRVRGRLDPERATWFGDRCAVSEEHDETVIRGIFRDQAALHGALAQLRDLGLTLLKVEAVG